MKKSIFISVSWSVAIKATLLAVVFSLLSFYVFREYLIDQVTQTIELTAERDYNQFEQLRLSSNNFQLGFVEAVSSTLRAQGHASVSGLSKTIENSWDTYNILYGLEQLSIYTESSHADKTFGESPTRYPQEIIDTINLRSEPFTLFLCNQKCYFVVGAPLLLENNKPAYIVLSTLAENLLRTFQLLTGAKAQLAYLDSSEGLRLITANNASKHLSQAIEDFNRQRQWNMGTSSFMTRTVNSYHSLSVRKVSDHQHLEDVYLFWSLDSTGLVKQHEQTLNRLILVMLFVGIALFFFLYTLLRSFATRSHHLAETLPLLTQSRYEEAEERLSQVDTQSTFYDDLDRLYGTSLVVTRQLQHMHEEIELQNKRLHKMAYRDSLTGLPNRQSFYEALEHQLRQLSRQDKYLGLLFIDIDGFKAVNDNYGHIAGDYILTTLSLRVKNCIRSADTLYRLAGDEFVVLIDNIDSDKGLNIIAAKVVNSMNKPVCWEDKILDVSLSVGGVMTKNSELEQDEFLHKADEAMYISKHEGKGRYTFLGIV